MLAGFDIVVGQQNMQVCQLQRIGLLALGFVVLVQLGGTPLDQLAGLAVQIVVCLRIIHRVHNALDVLGYHTLKIFVTL
jgi:hypothetical protein